MVLKTALGEDGRAVGETLNSTVVKASIQIPFSTRRIKSSRKEKLKEYTIGERLKKREVGDLSSVKRNQRRCE